MVVKIPRVPHPWNVSTKRAIAIQALLAPRVLLRGPEPKLRLAGGADLAFSPDKQTCIAGVVVWDVRQGTVVEQHVVHRRVRFPYVPGLLSFREAPAIVAALRKIRSIPDVFLFDGQGYAHPRRFGLACHVGVLIDRPSVGCAKSVLIGKCNGPAIPKGSQSPLVHRDEVIGAALRTRDGVRPVYVSVGHRLTLDGAIAAVLACCTTYRLPEPTRLADQLVSRERNRM